MKDSIYRDNRNPWIVRSAFGALVVFLILGVWQFVSFSMAPADDFYQPHGYIQRVNNMIRDGKLFSRVEKTKEGYRTVVRTANLQPEDQLFYEKSWLASDVDAFEDGDASVFLIDHGKLQSVNVYRHRIESPVASDWRWWGKIYSQSAEGYAYLWNTRRTLKLYRPPLQDRATAKPAQSDFRDVVYGRGHFFQTGLGIALKTRTGSRLAELYSLGDSIVLKSYASNCCFLNGHPVPRGVEQRLVEGDLVQVVFERNGKEEFLFHDFSSKPLSFVNVENGRLKRTDLDRTTLVHSLADGIEQAVRKSRPEGRQEFDIHLALDEDLGGLTQNALESYVKSLTPGKARASCTILDALNGQVIAVSSVEKKKDEVNGNLRLHPVGSATKIFLSAAAGQAAPDLLQLYIDPHPSGDEDNLLGYHLSEGYKLRGDSTGASGYTDFPTYIAKSCNRYHAILMMLSLARDSAVATGVDPAKLQHGIQYTDQPVETVNGNAYLGEAITNRPDISYFLTENSGRLECNNLENSELALNLERLFDVKRKSMEGSRDAFSQQPWNLLLARLGVAQSPDLIPAFYPILPQAANFGMNLNIDFRQDFISLIFGGANNRWSNVQLAEATARLVTNRRIHAQFVEKITDNGRETVEDLGKVEPLGFNPEVQKQLLAGMEAVCLQGGTAGDLEPLLQDLKYRARDNKVMEFYGKTGTPFRGEIRKGEQELYSSVFVFTALLRDRNGNLEDGLSFAVYMEDLGEHRAVDFVKMVLPRILAARGWL